MMDLFENSRDLALAGVFFVATGFISYLVITALFSSQTYKGRRILPYAPGGMIQTFSNMSTERYPQYMLSAFHDVEADHQVKSYRLNLPMGSDMFVIGDVGLARKILQEPKASKGNIYASFAPLGGTKENILSADTNKGWAFTRKTLRHAFSNREVSRMMDIAKEVADKWLDEQMEKQGVVFDASVEMTRLTFRVICKAAFEYDCSDKEFEEFGIDSVSAIEEFDYEFMNPIQKHLWFLFPGGRKGRASAARLQGLARRVLEHYRSLSPDQRSKSNTLIKLINDNEGFESDAQRIAELVLFMIAGHDTTGHTLGSTLVLLAENPDIAKKLQSEVDKVSSEDWKSCDYMKWTLRESMRLMPVAAAGPSRVTTRDYEIGKDWILPKGSHAMMPQIIPFHDSSVFENPEQFIPERWENATTEQKEAFVPFSLGARNCIGQSLAMSELESILPAIVSKFDLELVEKGEEVTFLTMKYSECKVKMSKRTI